MADLWVAVQVKSWDRRGYAKTWDLAGVFTTPEKAAEVCTEPGDSYWRVQADQFLGRETVPAPGTVFPHGTG